MNVSLLEDIGRRLDRLPEAIPRASQVFRNPGGRNPEINVTITLTESEIQDTLKTMKDIFQRQSDFVDNLDEIAHKTNPKYLKEDPFWTEVDSTIPADKKKKFTTKGIYGEWTKVRATTRRVIIMIEEFQKHALECYTTGENTQARHDMRECAHRLSSILERLALDDATNIVSVPSAEDRERKREEARRVKRERDERDYAAANNQATDEYSKRRERKLADARRKKHEQDQHHPI
jgi:hypothetical protein